MKHARIAWAGAVHDAIEADGQLQLLTPAFQGRRVGFDEVVWLPPLVPASPARTACGPGVRRALVIGRPLVGAGLMAAEDRDAVAAEIRAWLAAQGIERIFYKAHPKDPGQELRLSDYMLVNLDEALEVHLANTPYDAVLGVRSSALLFARQSSPAETRVIAFGWDRIRFKSDAQRRDMRAAFTTCGVEVQ